MALNRALRSDDTQQAALCSCKTLFCISMQKILFLSHQILKY